MFNPQLAHSRVARLSDTETWGNCHCSAPVTSCDCNSHTVRLPQAFSFDSVRFSPKLPSRHVLPTQKTLHDSHKTSIAVHLSSAEPLSSFLRKCLAFIEFQHRAGLVRLQGSHEPAVLPRSGTFRSAAWIGHSLSKWGSVAQGNRLRNQMLCPVEQCGTAQDGLGDDGSQTVKIKLHNMHQVHQI